MTENMKRTLIKPGVDKQWPNQSSYLDYHGDWQMPNACKQTRS